MAKTSGENPCGLLCLEFDVSFQEQVLASNRFSLAAPIATIDMGSNSYHLLVADWHLGGLRRRHHSVERVQTALLMDGSELTAEAEQRVLACLRRFRQLADDNGVERIIAVGTSALRQATNAGGLLRAAEEVLGSPVIVLSGADEARLIYRAVASRQCTIGERSLVIDIGGGSTELIVGCGEDIEDLESLALGCVSSLKQHFISGDLNADNFDRCVLAARQLLAPLVSRFTASGNVRVLGCSGTALAVAEVIGANSVCFSDLGSLREQLLARFSRIEQVAFAGLDHNRSVLLAPGLAILTALFDTLSISEMSTIDVALREGVAIAWYRGDTCIHPELPSIAI